MGLGLFKISYGGGGGVRGFSHILAHWGLGRWKRTSYEMRGRGNFIKIYLVEYTVDILKIEG